MKEYDQLLQECRTRADEIAALRLEGFTLQYIADRYGISGERVRQILINRRKVMLTVRTERDIRRWLNMMVELHGADAEYWFVEAAKAGMYDVQERALKGKMPVSIEGEI